MLEYFSKLINRRDEDGASAVEYGLLVAAIAAVIVAVVFLLGGVIKGAFDDTCKAVNKNTACTTSTPAATTP